MHVSKVQKASGRGLVSEEEAAENPTHCPTQSLSPRNIWGRQLISLWPRGHGGYGGGGPGLMLRKCSFPFKVCSSPGLWRSFLNEVSQLSGVYFRAALGPSSQPATGSCVSCLLASPAWLPQQWSTLCFADKATF